MKLLRKNHNEKFLNASLCLLLCLPFLLWSCAGSRVDPISPDIKGISVKPPPSLAPERYYYERYDPQTEEWYEAKELIPGFGLMVYTREGKRNLRKEQNKDMDR